MKRRIVIVGNGIAGITAARQLRKRCGDPITVISGETDYFFSRTALMYVYMGHMKFEHTKPYEDAFWSKNRIRLVRDWVEAVDTEQRRLRLASGGHEPFDVLIVASGSRSNKFGWPGQDLDGVQGLYGLPDLELMERNTRGIERGVVVGGGLIGIETAEMLLSRGIPVTMLVRERGWMDFAFPAEESAIIEREIRRHGVDLRLATELDSILAGSDGRARGVVTKTGEEVPCGFVALTVGVGPNVGWLADSGIECDRGVLVDGHLATNVPEVYAIGDCAQLRQPPPGRRAIEPVWYTGRAMGETVAATIAGHPTEHDPGIWFNSAKFFDVEWQIYGSVGPQPGPDHDTLYWEDETGTRSIRINYRERDQAVTGFNLMGIRYRHEVCRDWIARSVPLHDVVCDLSLANFDPELHAQFEKRIVGAFNSRFPDTPATAKQRRGLRRRSRAS